MSSIESSISQEEEFDSLFSKQKQTARIHPGQEWAPRQVIARLLGVHRSTIIRLEHSPEKHFPRPMKFGKCPLFNIEQVRRWALAQQEEG